MSDSVRCFLITPTNSYWRYLRRYRSKSDDAPCPTAKGYHDSFALIERVEDVIQEREWPWNDPRWPTHCSCGYKFMESDEHQVFHDRIWKRTDNGADVSLRDNSPGSMWFAPWLNSQTRYANLPDGPLCVICPDGHCWEIDGRASNCTLPHDNLHRCWIRSGTPPAITVSKEGGPTCGCGCSIGTPGKVPGTYNWHGFLRDGVFVEV